MAARKDATIPPRTPRFLAKFRRSLAVLGTALSLASPAVGQADPEVDEITVTARRRPEARMAVPAAISVVGRDEIQLARQQLGLDESLARVPGLFLQNRFNLSQDLRISIRGFGARSAFGIRGVKLFVDGVPATLADGQAGVDAIDLGSAERIEVLRGPASSLYGSATGGVIRITSEDPPEDPFVEARVSFGSDGFGKHQLKAGASANGLGVLVNAAYFSLDGHREQSVARGSSLNGVLKWQIADDERLVVSVNVVDSPWAGDPGGVNRLDSRENPTRARDANVDFDAGESLDQQRFGAVYERTLGEAHHLRVRGYAVTRDFANRLPFTGGGTVEFERFFGGGGVQYSYAGSDVWNVTIGFDVDAQRDDRERFDNLLGARGAKTLEQDEDVTSYGVYGMAELALGHDLTLSVGGRYDRVEFEVDDAFLSDGDDSGEIDFDHFSPSATLLWRPTADFALYASVATAFETPTTTEFASPTGGGFNTRLEEQRATNYEVGARGTGPLSLRYEAAVFRIDLEDELVPFEVASQPGRRFFRNSGRSTREGLELAASIEPFDGVVASIAYTYSDFEYRRFATPDGVFDGNRVPGIPKDQLFMELAYTHPSGFRVAWEALWADDFFVDDANTTFSRETLTSGIRLSHEIEIGGFEFEPFLGVHNLFDSEYDANVRINAFGGRYYEPAPDRSFYGGLRVRREF